MSEGGREWESEGRVYTRYTEVGHAPLHHKGNH